MSRYRLAQKSGIAQSSISTLLNRKSVPTIQTLEKICDGFGITLSQFFAEDERVLDLTKDQEELLKDWNLMDSRQQELVKAYIRGIIRKKGRLFCWAGASFFLLQEATDEAKKSIPFIFPYGYTRWLQCNIS